MTILERLQTMEELWDSLCYEENEIGAEKCDIYFMEFSD